MQTPMVNAEYIGPVKSLVRDPVGNRLWLYTATSLYQILFEREDRDVWQLYLEQAKNGDGREFEFAYQHAKTLKEKEVVRSAQADFYFQVGPALTDTTDRIKFYVTPPDPHSPFLHRGCTRMEPTS